MRPARRKPSRWPGSPAAAGREPRAPRPARAAPARTNLRRTVAQLRLGREAVTDIAGQLERLSALLRDPVSPIDATAPDHLAGAARQAQRAFSALAELRRLLP